MVLKIIDEKENIEAPHISGMKLPIVEPTATPSHIRNFEFICGDYNMILWV